MGCKAVETTCNINNTSGPGPAHAHAVYWWFKKFCKGDEPWRRGAQWLDIRSWQQPAESIIEIDPLTISGEAAEQLNISHSTVVRHLKQTGKVKKLDKWVPHELTEHQKIVLLRCRLILHNNEPFLHRTVTCNKKMDLIQLVMTSSMAGWRRSYKALPKAKHALKKVVVTTVWWSAACLSHYSFLSPGETITSENSAQQADVMPAKGSGQQKGPQSSPQQGLTAHRTINASEVEWIALQSFASSAIFMQALANTNYHFFKHLNNFLQGKCFYNKQEAENAFQECVQSPSTDSYATGINKLISHWQKCIDCNDSYFD